jgi:hypothetical protein
MAVIFVRDSVSDILRAFGKNILESCIFLNIMKLINSYTGIIAACCMAFAGCYTQFATLDTYTGSNDNRAVTSEDSTTDTIQQAQSKDTVVVKEREICYWQRDFFGNRHLRCYTSYYDADWYDYYNQPWWYGSYSSYYRPDCLCNCSRSYYSGYPYYNRYDDCDDYCYWYCRSVYDRRSYDYGGGGSYGQEPSSSGSKPASVHPPRRQVGSGFPASQGAQPSARTIKSSQYEAGPALKIMRDTLKTQIREAIISPVLPDKIVPDDDAKVRRSSDRLVDVPAREPGRDIGGEAKSRLAVPFVVDTAGKQTSQDRRRRSVRKW